MNETLKIAHFSDTHFGREDHHEATAANGAPQRGVDIVRAGHAVVSDIISRSDVPLALHAGDVCDTPAPAMQYMVAARQELVRLARPLSAASQYVRQVVVISGNHDMPRSPNVPSHLALYRGIPGVHVITSGYTQVSFEAEVAAGVAHPSLADVVIHALPHDDLKSTSFDEIHPVEGKINILLSHGVAGGSSLFFRSIGREYPIPRDVLRRDWDYVALGHWHRRGPVFLSEKETESKVWYAGSPENTSFSDLDPEDPARGYLLVDVEAGAQPVVTRVDLPIRRMMMLPVIDAEGKTTEEISSLLLERVEEADAAGILRGSIVRQRVINVLPDLWSLVNRRDARDAAAPALAYNVQPRFRGVAADSAEDAVATAAEERTGEELARTLEKTAEDLLDEKVREPALKVASDLLGTYLDTPVTTEES